MPSYMCVSSQRACGGNGDVPVNCSSSTQCPSGQVCCGDWNGQSFSVVSCRQGTACGAPNGIQDYQLCNPQLANDCPRGTMCQVSDMLPGYYECL
jgi:hypothetical protein